ncbi:hybrid sensor histidine kinase/response regulator [Xanthomonas nasturtii]|uniref:histidine kinase n=1 Tax=Xanthomonas nasturtii TaxID=1843581 RepID=A0ABT0LTG7_9XANT|nr:PAS domain-containing protein [Xanthomonas nasturtii]MCL1500438.1 PAS domain-containing protein [Xanthomonas nasturtii]MCL1504212.1 PAS domain-containing protein [Xanthomonas nasturtii]MCL1524033.1 PAS domain-containing protein [Xanthomonas nasturtii]MCL1552636.1 PAS domain-containing protein [Xanthomonas nasturtii]MCL1556804.1 PAS domain-containing protein [Xanthomonas nasturtii]
MTTCEPDGSIVHIIAPFGRDAESIAGIVGERGLTRRVYTALDALAGDLHDASGVVVLTEEAVGGDLHALSQILQGQQAWSDIPFVLLRTPRGSHNQRHAHLPAEMTNVIELERPLSSASLLSAISTALRSRQKQFVIRDQLAQLAQGRAALAQSEAELRRVTDALPVLIAFIDKNLVYRFANRSYEDWIGVPPADVIGRPLVDVMGPAVLEERRAWIEAALAGQTLTIETSWPHADGRRRDAEIRYMPRFDADGQVDGFHVFATDVTTRTQALESIQQQASVLEAKVVERTAELQQQMLARESSEAALRQAQKMEAVGQLTGGIAHDFNNMLTGILSALDLARLRIDQGRTEGLGRFLDVASASALRAAALTQRLLAFSRRQSLEARHLHLNDLVVSLQELLARTLGESVRLQTDLHAQLPQAYVDENQLESALLNLAINARDAMPDGGQLRIATRHLQVQDQPLELGRGVSLAPGNYAVVSVADTGTGMAADVLERVFEPFYTTKPIGQGTGLGMSMIYGFMQQSNGQVWVESQPGAGTTVSLYLPAGVDVQSAVPLPQNGEVLAGQGQQVLVVEDDEQVRLLVTELLSELGYQADVVADADAALPILASPRRIDLLVTDVGLPGLNGRQLAEIARQSRRDLPVIFMTGYAETARDRGEFLAEGMSMIAKPFTLGEFSGKLQEVLGPSA